MSKKNKNNKNNGNTSGNKDAIKFCAFWGLALAAILFIVTAILNLISSFWTINGIGTIIYIVDVVAKVALLIAIGIPAWSYVNRKSKGWKVFYFLALLIYALGIVFSIIKF